MWELVWHGDYEEHIDSSYQALSEDLHWVVWR